MSDPMAVRHSTNLYYFFLLSYLTGPLYLPGVEHGTIIGISSARWKSRLSCHAQVFAAHVSHCVIT